jgi:cellulose synthase/poly-beta-1,6-N-acetylglucosamine synthase-like glycosyltransferase
MILLIDLGLAAAGLLAIIATLALVIQAFANIALPERPLPAAGRRPSVAVLVPAHDEAEGITRTLEQLWRELAPGDRLLVIADNCTDDTARHAAETGAEVLVRTDRDRRGKGFALAAGLAHLEQQAFDVFVFVDADCRFGSGGLARLASACLALDAPVQCLSLMTGAHGAVQRSRLGAFAWRLRNNFRPSGYARLGLPCQLFGTGMAMPGHLTRPALFATGHVAEDLLIGLECALAGSPPRYVRGAILQSHFPANDGGRDSQKRRWVHGHLAVIRSHVPRLLREAWRRRSWPLLALALDILVPPLSLLAGAHGLVALAAAALFVLTGATAALAVSLTGLALLLFALITAWRVSGRNLIGRKELAQLPAHAGRVMLTVMSFAAGRRSGWVRADRSRT